MTDRLTAIDLYAGAGGATQGLTDASVTVLAAVEIDPTAARSYRLNHPKVKMRARDIRQVDASRLRRQLGLRKGELSILQACPPCPSWSTLGAKSADDGRKELVADVGRFIKAFMPRAFILENVPGLAADARLSTLLAMASRIGYGTATYLVRAEDAGVPQRRRRLIVLGVHGLQSSSLPEKDLLSALPKTFDRTRRTVKDAFALIDPDPRDELGRGRTHSAKIERRIRAIPVGGTRFDLPEELRLACHEGLGHRATSAYGRMRLDDVAPTLTTRCTTPSCGSFVHPIEHRGITLREAAVLQTFPLGYRFEGKYDAIERQIGNAIPVRLAAGVGTLALNFIAEAARLVAQT